MRISDWSSDVCSSDLVYAELTAAQLPEFGVTPDADALARVLGLDSADLRSGSEGPRAVSCGLPFVLVPLRAPELLAAIDFDSAGARRVLASSWAKQLDVYARGHEGEFRARMVDTGSRNHNNPATRLWRATL